MIGIWHATWPILIWMLTSVLTLVGIAGVVIPVLPGTTLILVAMGLHQVLLPTSAPGWWWSGAIVLIWLMSVIGDFVSVMIGTKWFGGTKWGAAGATGGALVGMFFSLPILLLGTMLGAMVAEKLVAKKDLRTTMLSGAGATVGFLVSTVVRLACALGMVAAFLLGVWQAA
ncbi:MAG: DUF456 domain-containing protein [Opitutaceae bacterium]|jgi:uncharacterized protein YqgC (DUF456 family)|nr:DUF456 domain-containing protein [Opitutaceae bacterium]